MTRIGKESGLKSFEQVRACDNFMSASFKIPFWEGGGLCSGEFLKQTMH